MDVVIAGAHGQIARLLTRRLAGRGDRVTGIVRNPDHLADVRRDGATGTLLDLEHADVAQVADILRGSDAVVFAAGAGPGSGMARKETVDRAAAVLLADAAERAHVGRFVQVSSMGTDAVRDGATPPGVDEVFVAYLRAKAAAEDDLRGRDTLAWTVLRPGRLTDGPATGQVSLAAHVPRGEVTRDDVAAALVAVLDSADTVHATLEVTGGSTPVADALAALTTSKEN